MDKVYASDCLVRIKGKLSKAKADQIATVSKLRLGKRLGKVTKKELAQIEKAIKLQLGIRK